MSYKLGRRAFLAGAGGAVVALPMLEAMEPTRSAAQLGGGAPKRFLIVYGGTSVDNTHMVPSASGAGYDLTRGLITLAGRQHAELAPPGLEYNSVVTSGLEYDSVVDEVSMVSGLRVPWDTGGGVPSGGRLREFHASTVGPVLSGMRASSRSYDARGESADQIVKRALAEDTRFSSLEYRVQVKNYRGETGEGDRARMSWSQSDGRVVANDPIVSPRVAYDQLFRGFEPEDPAEAEARRRLLAQDRSVLDLVRSGSDRLLGRLGLGDQRRMERYFDEVRALERSIDEIPDAPGGVCRLPPDPGADPPVDIRHCSEKPGDDCRYEYVDGWANEERRARAMCDLIHMAFACDLTRTASLMMTFGQSFLNMNETLGINNDVHGIGHSGVSRTGTADVVAWHLKHLAYLIDKLRNTPEGSGTVLDNTIIVFQMEGGWGRDPEGGRDNSAHSSENMISFVAGGGGALRLGEHVVAPDAHPAQVTVSAMNAVGVETDRLGEVVGGLDGLEI